MKKIKLKGKWVIWVLVVALLLAFLPDPTDVIDAGTPILELIVAFTLYWFGVKK